MDFEAFVLALESFIKKELYRPSGQTDESRAALAGVGVCRSAAPLNLLGLPLSP